jgi:hypothetical protein
MKYKGKWKKKVKYIQKGGGIMKTGYVRSNIAQPGENIVFEGGG